MTDSLATASGGEPAGAGTSRARFVALGVLASRMAGLVRAKVVNHFLGVGALGDVITAAFRVPNLLQNLFGDQAMAAAFIPIYSRLVAEERRDEARAFASAILGLLMVTVAVLVLVGVALAPWLVALFNPGYLQDADQMAAGHAAFDRYPLAVVAARIMFPMAGVLVLAAWTQAVLNSHRRFLISYLSPVAWNAAIIAALAGFAWQAAIDPRAAPLETLSQLVIAACIGALVGGILQVAVQLPLVFRVAGRLRPSLSLSVPNVGTALRALGPALAGRGVVQISFYLDLILASTLRAGAQLALQNGALFYNLPFAVFATSVAASELPELAAAGKRDRAELSDRLSRSLKQVLFLVVPSALGYLAFGWLLVGLLRGGAFGADDQMLVYAVLAAYTLGMPASAISRLLQNAFFVLGDTATPARLAGIRVVLAVTIGAGAMVGLDRFSVGVLGIAPDPGQPLFLGAVGLALGSAVGAWAEVSLLGSRLKRRVGARLGGVRAAMGFLVVALATSVPAAALWWLLRDVSHFLSAFLVPATFAALYLGVAWRRGSPELRRWLSRVG